jgi:oligopeptide transport system ATP-binding protein
LAVLMDVKGLVTRFYTQEGTVYAVNNVSYVLNEGETLGVVGESGSGKSVHALAMMGLIPSPPGKVEEGEVTFRGRDLLKLSSEQMRLVRGAEIAMIFQDPMTSLNPVLTIGTQITEALKLHLGMNNTEARTRAAELLTLVGIPDAEKRLNHYPHQFSGGMRQRVMIAIGLSCNPKLLIADEEFDMAIIWISHDLGVVAGIADTINVMYAGTIVERGPVEEVFGDPRHPYTLGLMLSLPRMDASNQRLVSIEGAPPDMRNPIQGCPFAPRCPYRLEKCWTETPALEPIPDSEGVSHLMACWVDVREAEPRAIGAAPA